MKKLIIFLIIINVSLTSFAQLFGGEKVYIYGIKFRAKEVTGQKKFNSNSEYYRTNILDPLVKISNDEYYYTVGSYRREKNIMETLDLFNLSLQNNHFPFLDSIDFDYYKSIGFSRIETKDPTILKDYSYLELKALLDSTGLDIWEKKDILFDPKYQAYRNRIILSRYEIQPNEFSVDQTKKSEIASEVKAQLDTIQLNTTVEVAAKIRAYLSSLADEAINITGYYLDVRLDPAYIAKIDFYISTTPKIKIGNDQFATNLKAYVESTNSAANTSLVAIQLNGTFNKTKIDIDSISADLSGKFSLSANDSKKIATSINFTFSRNETTTFKNKFNNTFLIRYFTSSIIDIAAFPKNKFF